MPLSATAEGSDWGGTCSLTEACHAGPNSAIPLPTVKQKKSRRPGVMEPNHATSVRQIDPRIAIVSAARPTFRRSNISATAPAMVDRSATGNIKAVCTSATLSGDDVICVIDHAAPTPMISSPRLDNKLAVQMRRNTAWRSGAKTPLARILPLLTASLILQAAFGKTRVIG